MRFHSLLCRFGIHCPTLAGNGGIYCACCRKLVSTDTKPRLDFGGKSEPLGVEYWGWPL